VLYPWDASTGLPQAAVDQLYQSSFAAVPHIREARIDGAYHFLMLDQPEAFDREVGVFLGR
jgi:pimeloyl-ACP methyl ester carboxylesterase